MPDVRREVIDRLERARIGYYVTGSEALALLGVGYRATSDIDVVLLIGADEFALRIVPLFEQDYAVGDLVHSGSRYLASAIAQSGIGKVDLIIREQGPWPEEAARRRQQIDDPGLGMVWVSTAEDLLIAKLERSDGNLDGIQGRDCVRIVQTFEGLDWAYVHRHTSGTHLEALLEEVVRRAAHRA